MTKKEELEQIASGSCSYIGCRKCPVRQCCDSLVSDHDVFNSNGLNIKLINKAKDMIIDKEIEEFLGE